MWVWVENSKIYKKGYWPFMLAVPVLSVLFLVLFDSIFSSKESYRASEEYMEYERAISKVHYCGGSFQGLNSWKDGYEKTLDSSPAIIPNDQVLDAFAVCLCAQFYQDNSLGYGVIWITKLDQCRSADFKRDALAESSNENNPVGAVRPYLKAIDTYESEHSFSIWLHELKEKKSQMTSLFLDKFLFILVLGAWAASALCIFLIGLEVFDYFEKKALNDSSEYRGLKYWLKSQVLKFFTAKTNQADDANRSSLTNILKSSVSILIVSIGGIYGSLTTGDAFRESMKANAAKKRNFQLYTMIERLVKSHEDLSTCENNRDVKDQSRSLNAALENYIRLLNDQSNDAVTIKATNKRFENLLEQGFSKISDKKCGKDEKNPVWIFAIHTDLVNTLHTIQIIVSIRSESDQAEFKKMNSALEGILNSNKESKATLEGIEEGILNE